MEVKIKPRKATDRGGDYCMPLFQHPARHAWVDDYNMFCVRIRMLADPASRYKCVIKRKTSPNLKSEKRERLEEEQPC